MISFSRSVVWTPVGCREARGLAGPTVMAAAAFALTRKIDLGQKTELGQKIDLGQKIVLGQKTPARA